MTATYFRVNWISYFIKILNIFYSKIDIQTSISNSKKSNLGICYFLVIILSLIMMTRPVIALDTCGGQKNSTSTKNDDYSKARNSSCKASNEINRKEGASAENLDQTYGWKGWDIHFPSYGDTVLQDDNGWRSALASKGFGVTVINENTSATNVLNTPDKGPAYDPYLKTHQTYNGQKPTITNILRIWITYDLSRWGIPDGQLQISGGYAHSTYQGFVPNDALSFNTVAYYQTLFDRRVELKVGIYPSQYDFLGQNIGGNFANTTGPAGAIPTLLGMTTATSVSPAARITVHLSKGFYDEFGVMRGLPVTGATGNPYFDGVKENMSGLKWSLKDTKEVFVNEFGYKAPSTPSELSNWVRFGVIYNDADYNNFQHPGNINSGNKGIYLLDDHQITQSSKSASYQGIYAGFTAEYAPPKNTSVTQYYEGRLYWIGPFSSRPTDVLSLVAYHQVNSHYLVDSVNADPYISGTYGWKSINSITAAYLMHIMPGVYGQVGMGYTQHPTITYFGPSIANPDQRREGNALNVLANLIIAF